MTDDSQATRKATQVKLTDRFKSYLWTGNASYIKQAKFLISEACKNDEDLNDLERLQGP